MRKNFVPYVSSIVFFTIAIIGIDLLLVFIYSLIQSGTELFRALADALFFEGGIMLTLGALVEFFLKAQSYSLARRLLLPYSMAGMAVCQSMPAVPEGEADLPDDKRSGGWMLIFIGALLAIASLAFAII